MIVANYLNKSISGIFLLYNPIILSIWEIDFY